MCVRARVPPMEAAPLASFTTSPSCSSSQSATYCDLLPSTSPSAPPTFPYLCSGLLLWTSPFPLSTCRFRLISLVVSFPSPLHLLVFHWLTFFLPPTAHLPLPWTLCVLSLLLNSPKWPLLVTFIPFYSRFMSILLSPSASTAMYCTQRCWPRVSNPWQARLWQLSVTWGRIPAKHQREGTQNEWG